MSRFVVEKLRSEAMIKSMNFFCDGRVAAGIPCRAGLRMDYWIVLGVGSSPRCPAVAYGACAPSLRLAIGAPRRRSSIKLSITLSMQGPLQTPSGLVASGLVACSGRRVGRSAASALRGNSRTRRLVDPWHGMPGWLWASVWP